ncbi:MAG: type II toxin-antitoxin system RelE/ParE family toxin [Chloroflexota bacterium]|nr:type II toxin-antitoxin system RelE/ParE family toxin [Chloroflexota bacterium]
MRIIWSAPARREWAEHYRFYATRNPEAARRVQQLVMSGAARLREHPQLGRPGRVEGSRELIISGTPFLLVYDPTPDRIEIVHVYHGRQNWAAESAE